MYTIACLAKYPLEKNLSKVTWSIKIFQNWCVFVCLFPRLHKQISCFWGLIFLVLPLAFHLASIFLAYAMSLNNALRGYAASSKSLPDMYSVYKSYHFLVDDTYAYFRCV